MSKNNWLTTAKHRFVQRSIFRSIGLNRIHYPTTVFRITCNGLVKLYAFVLCYASFQEFIKLGHWLCYSSERAPACTLKQRYNMLVQKHHVLTLICYYESSITFFVYYNVVYVILYHNVVYVILYFRYSITFFVTFNSC